MFEFEAHHIINCLIKVWFPKRLVCKHYTVCVWYLVSLGLLGVGPMLGCTILCMVFNVAAHLELHCAITCYYGFQFF